MLSLHALYSWYYIPDSTCAEMGSIDDIEHELQHVEEKLCEAQEVFISIISDSFHVCPLRALIIVCILRKNGTHKCGNVCLK